MYCEKCGKVMSDDARFCASCGEPVADTSSKGGEGISPHARRSTDTGSGGAPGMSAQPAKGAPASDGASESEKGPHRKVVIRTVVVIVIVLAAVAFVRSDFFYENIMRPFVHGYVEEMQQPDAEQPRQDTEGRQSQGSRSAQGGPGNRNSQADSATRAFAGTWEVIGATIDGVPYDASEIGMSAYVKLDSDGGAFMSISSGGATDTDQGTWTVGTDGSQYGVLFHWEGDDAVDEAYYDESTGYLSNTITSGGRTITMCMAKV